MNKQVEQIRAEIKRLEGIDYPCDTHEQATGFYNALDRINDFLDTLQEPEQTCKTCGFYENNCPFIRGKLIPCPNKVCKDYTYSVVKAEQEPEVNLEKEIDKTVNECTDEYNFDWDKFARHFYELGQASVPMPEEQPSKDLEEAAEKYADKHGFRVPYDGSNNYYDDVDVKASKEGFLAGAEWQKKQMEDEQ